MSEGDKKREQKGLIRSTHFGTKGAYISLFIVVITGVALWWTGALERLSKGKPPAVESNEVDTLRQGKDTLQYEDGV